MPILGDVAAGPVFYWFGIVAGLLVLAAIIVIEAVVLRLFGWSLFKQAVRDAAIVNLATTVIGVVLIVLVQPRSAGYDPERGGRLYDPPLVDPTLGFVLSLILSIIIEGAILLRWQRQPARKIWTAALVMNLASYLLLGLFLTIISRG